MNEIISVIMSTYNEPEEYLRQSIESILNQTYRSIQFLIVLDNPGNQMIKRLLTEYESRDNRIRVLVNKNNVGLTASLNSALKYVDGQYVARMDADDISKERRFERQLEYMKLHNLDLVGCETTVISEEGKTLKERQYKSFPPDCVSDLLLCEDCIAHPTWLVKTELYRKVDGYRDIAACEDYNLILRAKQMGFHLGICDEVLLDYRINTKGISQNNVLRQVLSSLYMQKHFTDIQMITQGDIEQFLYEKNTKENNIAYINGMRYLRRAIEEMKKRDAHFVMDLLKSVSVSKYVFINLKWIIKAAFIRKKHRV